MKILKGGDKGEAICDACSRRVTTTYEYRSVHLDRSDVDVDDVLVGVCDRCDQIVSIPSQSTPKLKEERLEKRTLVNYRLPRHLDDVLRLIADELDASTASFSPLVLRFYLREIQQDQAFARRVARLAKTDLAHGRAETRLAFRLSEDLLSSAWANARNVGIRTKTDMVKGLIVAAKEDVLESRAKGRRRTLRGIAATV